MSDVNARVLQAEAINSHNTFQNPVAVAPQLWNEVQLITGKASIALPPMSVMQICLFEPFEPAIACQLEGGGLSPADTFIPARNTPNAVGE